MRLSTDAELQLRQHVVFTQYLAEMIQTNTKISMGIIRGNPTQIGFQLVKLKQETFGLLEAIGNLEEGWKIQKLVNKTEDQK